MKFVPLSILIFFFPLAEHSFLQPSLQWASVYNYSIGVEAALAITLDDSGNVFVTGGSEGPTTNIDIATVKYGPDGTQKWSSRFNGVQNGDDRGTGIILDKNKNLYTSGCYLIKHNSFTGDTIFVKNLIELGACGEKLNIDNASYLYTSSGTSYGFNASKFDTSGNLVWLRQFNSANTGAHNLYDQAMDNSNNLIITGRIKYGPQTIQYSATTIKYSPEGDSLWVRHYNTPDSLRRWDQSNACAVDEQGNVYVTGFARMGNGIAGDCLIIKYKPNGDSAWVRLFDDGSSGESGEDIEVDREGNVYVAVRINDVLNGIVKYNADGAFQWVRTYPIFTFGSFPRCKLDQSGNIYISSSVIRDAWSDFRLTKYNSVGDEMWFAIYPGTGIGFNDIYEMATDNTNSVYTTGSSRSNYITVKYSQTTGIPNNIESIPGNYLLHQNYPNPFNPNTTISFELPKRDFVEIKIFDVSGKEIKTLVKQFKEPGKYNVFFDGSNFPSGTYFYKIEASEFSDVRKMILVK